MAPDGTISTFAGGGDPDVLGDGGPATAASLRAPRGLALGADGTLFVAEASRDRVRRITPDGRISTAAGGGSGGLGDGGPATEATLDLPTDVAIDEQGTLFVADALNHRVRRIDATGAITTIAGDGGAASDGDGGPATDASIGQPYGLDVGDDGSVYVSDRINHVVRRIDRDGPHHRLRRHRRARRRRRRRRAAAGPPLLPGGRHGRARRRRPHRRHRQRAHPPRRPGLPGFTDADFSLPSEDGTEVYMFDRDGRHLRTVEALTGAVKWTFGYDGAGRLVTVTDGSATPNVTTIERDGSGRATAIVAPGGIRTGLFDPARRRLARLDHRARHAGRHARLLRRRPAEDPDRPARPRRRPSPTTRRAGWRPTATSAARRRASTASRPRPASG